ncbi:LppP/LprE family lipoprotein [uncultured Rothia sp.]|uniref:LppP/LprE family lipoprotein n=1 Tax=uncultured Rothia sp. TaxID=316088 RepID=UPI0028D5F427|nr:LppP/LprE family lipoprotein [uncultured Rothia sp.]
MSSNRHRFTGRTALALPALGAALALVVTSCSASTDSAVSGTVVSSSGSASASASATSTQALFPTPSASPSASASATPSASSPAPVPSVVTITVHAEPTASESKSDSKSEAKSESKKDSTCASDSASTVVSKALRELKNKSKWNQWTNVSEDYEGYDPCAELSWIDAIPGSSHKECCISSMVHHILLFHRGKFIGTATYEPYSFSPVITRTSDSSIRVTYRYMKEDEAPASASGSTTAEFTWNPAKNQVDMEGTPPPSYNS